MNPGTASRPRPGGHGAALTVPHVTRALTLTGAAAASLCLLALLVVRFGAPPIAGLLVGLAAAAVMLVKPGTATVLGIFLIYINFPAILTKQHGLPHVVAGSFILIFAFPLAYSLLVRREPLRVDATFGLMLLLLVVFLLSALTMAVDSGVALSTVLEFTLEGLLLYAIVLNVVRRGDTLRRVLWTVLFAGAFLSSLSLYQAATGGYDQEFGGLAYRNYEVVQDAPDREGAARRSTWDRAQGSVNEPNRFAQVLIVLLPLAVYMRRHAASRPARWWSTIAGMLVLSGVVLTLSRGAFLGLVVITIMMVAVKWIRLTHVLAFLLVFALSVPAVPFFSHRMSSIAPAVTGLVYGSASASGSVDSSSLARVTLMRAAWRVFLDYPVLGVGPGQFPPYYSMKYSRLPEVRLRDMPPGNWRAHSLYLEIAAETGVAGICLFGGIVLLLLHGLWTARRRWSFRDAARADLATAFFFSIVAYQFTGIFLHLSYQRYYWFLLALASAALHMTYDGSTYAREDGVGSVKALDERAGSINGGRTGHVVHA